MQESESGGIPRSVKWESSQIRTWDTGKWASSWLVHLEKEKYDVAGYSKR